MELVKSFTYRQVWGTCLPSQTRSHQFRGDFAWGMVKAIWGHFGLPMDNHTAIIIKDDDGEKAFSWSDNTLTICNSLVKADCHPDWHNRAVPSTVWHIDNEE